MTSTEEEWARFFEEQVELEEEIVKSMNQALKTLTNPVVIGILKGISLDSMKHAQIYRAAIEISSATPAVTQEEFDRLRKTVKEHIVYEERAIDRLNRVRKKTENEKLKFLLESILSDERRHHKLLNKIMDIVVRGETITEEDWWEFLWGDVPFHGAPGG